MAPAGILLMYPQGALVYHTFYCLGVLSAAQRPQLLVVCRAVDLLNCCVIPLIQTLSKPMRNHNMSRQ